jgi:carboxymethylenebutenolidase
MTQRVEFASKSGSAQQGEIAEPAGAAKAPALVVIQEWWGVNDHVRSLVDRFAAEGFLAFAPDLFHGKTTRDATEAAGLLQALDWAQAIDEVAGAVSMLASHARGNGKVGITGFCMGGAVSLVSAAKIPQVSAAAPFYGLPDPSTDFSGVVCPIQGHYAKKDEHIRPENVLALKAKLEKAGKKVELHFYDAGHAFMNDTRPEAYNAAAAKVAWERAVLFLKTHLA